MRLIDANELMEHVYRDRLDSRELIANMVKKAPTVKEIPMNIPVDLIFKALEQEQKAEWISVNEMLPNDNMRCLVSVGEFFITEIAVYSDLMGTIDHKIFYIGDYGKYNFEDITKYVKAWRKLPKPYKESEDEG